MRRPRPDPAFSELLDEFLKAEVFPKHSAEAQILSRVVQEGLQALADEEHAIWLERVLPVVSKPLCDQVAVARILRNGGRVSKRIDPLDQTGRLADPFPLQSLKRKASHQ